MKRILLYVCVKTNQQSRNYFACIPGTTNWNKHTKRLHTTSFLFSTDNTIKERWSYVRYIEHETWEFKVTLSKIWSFLDRARLLICHGFGSIFAEEDEGKVNKETRQRGKQTIFLYFATQTRRVTKCYYHRNSHGGSFIEYKRTVITVLWAFTLKFASFISLLTNARTEYCLHKLRIDVPTALQNSAHFSLLLAKHIIKP